MNEYPEGPVTPENYEAKIAAVRALCLEEERREHPHPLALDIMCVLKYGEGFRLEELPSRSRPRRNMEPVGRSWWQFWRLS